MLTCGQSFSGMVFFALIAFYVFTILTLKQFTCRRVWEKLLLYNSTQILHTVSIKRRAPNERRV